MLKFRFLPVAVLFGVAFVVDAEAQAPTTAQFQQALERGGRYHDVDGGRAGEYGYNAASSTISFRGGFLSGQTGNNVRTTGFKLTETVSCEPWR